MLCLPTGFGKQEIFAAPQEAHPDQHAAPSGTFDVKSLASAPTVVGRTFASNCRSQPCSSARIPAQNSESEGNRN
jgi:hypothetical protein